MYTFHAFEKRATVAPSTTLWSADHETDMIAVGLTTARPLNNMRRE